MEPTSGPVTPHRSPLRSAEERAPAMVQPDEHRSERIAGRSAAGLPVARTALNRATTVLPGHEADEGMKAAQQALHRLRGQIEELAPGGPADVRATHAVVHLVGGDLERLPGRQQRSPDEVPASCAPPVDKASTEASSVDLALLGRCHQSCARHAVSAAGQVAALFS